MEGEREGREGEAGAFGLRRAPTVNNAEKNSALVIINRQKAQNPNSEAVACFRSILLRRFSVNAKPVQACVLKLTMITMHPQFDVFIRRGNFHVLHWKVL